MRPVVLATCDQLPLGTADTGLLVYQLQQLGCSVRVTPWTEIGSMGDRIVLHTPWDYTQCPAEFADWLVSHDGQLVNPAHVALWNMNKAMYLPELIAAGIPVIPTWFAVPGESLTPAVDRWGLPLVSKPAIGAGAQGLRLWRRDDDREGAVEFVEQTLVQPFVPEIVAGELSVVLIGGRVSHVVRKRPRQGEVRSQPEFGAELSLAALPDGWDELYSALLPWVEHLPFARVDVVSTVEGLLVMEVEVLEPDLFLRLSQTAARALAEAIIAV